MYKCIVHLTDVLLFWLSYVDEDLATKESAYANMRYDRAVVRYKEVLNEDDFNRLMADVKESKLVGYCEYKDMIRVGYRDNYIKI